MNLFENLTKNSIKLLALPSYSQNIYSDNKYTNKHGDRDIIL